MRHVDARTLNDTEFASALALRQGLDRDRDPHLPVTRPDELRATFADNTTDYSRHDRLVLFGPDDAAVAIAHLELTWDPNNTHMAGMDITTTDTRAADIVLAPLLDRARADNRTLILGWGDHTPGRDDYWTGLGAEQQFTEQESDLELDLVDPDLMDKWIAGAPDDVDLVSWTGPCPPEWLDTYAVTETAMNDAPIEGLDINDFAPSVDDVRDEFTARAACGYQSKVVLAVAPDGSAAGCTAVQVNRHRPAFSWQWNTVVLSAHRRRGIGRWIKAEMWRRLREEEPEVKMLRTGNAQSNDAMLAINIEMGFRPSHLQGVWQGDIDVIEAGLRDRTAR